VWERQERHRAPELLIFHVEYGDVHVVPDAHDLRHVLLVLARAAHLQATRQVALSRQGGMQHSA
jgi:hypothetical protein